jgi:hypothetical protein
MECLDDLDYLERRDYLDYLDDLDYLERRVCVAIKATKATLVRLVMPDFLDYLE